MVQLVCMIHCFKNEKINLGFSGRYTIPTGDATFWRLHRHVVATKNIIFQNFKCQNHRSKYTWNLVLQINIVVNTHPPKNPFGKLASNLSALAVSRKCLFFLSTTLYIFCGVGGQIVSSKIPCSL